MGGVRDCVTSDCSGLCCVSLIIPMTPAQLAERQAPDAWQLIDMLEPMTKRQAEQRYKDFGGTPGPEFDQRGVSFYRCKNFNEDTRLCEIYEDRPSVCSKFPYGGKCRHGCSCVGEAYSEGEDEL